MLASLIAGFASGETGLAVRRMRRAAIAYLLAGVAALCGIGFLIGAGYIAAARRYGSLETSIAFGIGFLVLACIVLLVHRLAAGSRKRKEAQRRSQDVTALAVASALALLPSLLRKPAGLGAVAAPAIAAVAYAIYRENRPRRRRSDDEG